MFKPSKREAINVRKEIIAQKDSNDGGGDDGCECRVISLNDWIVVTASEMAIFD